MIRNSRPRRKNPSFSSDGKILAVALGPWLGEPSQAQIKFWDIDTKRQILSISFGNTHGLVSFHDAMPLVAAAAGNVVGVWRYQLTTADDTVDAELQLDSICEVTLQRPSVMVGLDPRARYVFWSEIEEIGDLGGFDRAILLGKDLETGRMLPFNRAVGSGWNEFEFLPDGRRIILAACGSPGQTGAARDLGFPRERTAGPICRVVIPRSSNTVLDGDASKRPSSRISVHQERGS